ncbi:hypothetical protein JCM3766R1_007043 [Sporobolomyces carnicolor]
MRSSLLRLSHRVSHHSPSPGPKLPSLHVASAATHPDTYHGLPREISRPRRPPERDFDRVEKVIEFDSPARTNTRAASSQPAAKPRLDSTTADSSLASTSKGPFPEPATWSRLPPTASSILLASVSESLPTSERDLFRLLRRIRSTHPSLSATWFYQLHSSPRFNLASSGAADTADDCANLASSRTYAFVLDLAFAESNLALVEAILDDYKRHPLEFEWDNDFGRILLKGYRKLGMEDEAREVLTRLEQQAGAGRRSETEWIVHGRYPQRVSIGSKGKGKAREVDNVERLSVRGGEGVGWKGWQVRFRDLEKARLKEPKEQDAPTLLSGGQSGGGLMKKKKRPRFGTPVLTGRVQRPAVLVPPEPERLSSSSVTQLVQLLVHDERTDEAFSLADTWLKSNRPTLPLSARTSPTRDLVTASRKYSATLFVFVNILLKPLLLARSPMPTLFAFVSDFVARHSPPEPLPRPLAPSSTIREILSGIVGRKNAWRTGKRVVDHFGYKWGLPVGDGGFERIEFEGPTCERWRKYLCLGDLAVEQRAKSSTGAILDGERWKVRPHRFVPPSIAILLLRLAVDSQENKVSKLDTDGIERFRRWWTFVEARERGSDYFHSARARELLIRAGQVGLLAPYEPGKKRKGWYLTRQREISRSRKRGKEVQVERKKLA